MSFKIEGVIYRKFETEQKGASFSARDFVLEVQDGNFPQHIKFQLVQDRCDLIDRFTVGDSVVVHFDLRGKEWNDKFFTNLNAWKIEEMDSGGDVMDASGTDPFSALPQHPGDTKDVVDTDDLPF